MTVERIAIENKEQWLTLRANDVTASVVPALFNCHPYWTQLKVYALHRGVEFPEKDDEDNPVLRRGRWLEPAVAKAVAERRPEWLIEKANDYFRDPDERLGATPDFFIRGDPRGLGVLQTKSVAKSVYVREWENGTVVPFWCVLQTLTECMLTDAAFGVAAALLVDPHAMDVAILEVPRHPGGEAKIIATLREFWWRVDRGIEPVPDFGKDAAIIKALRPKEVEGKAVDLAGNNYIAEILAQRAALMARIKADNERCEEIENEIKYLMADAEFISGVPGWKVTYKSSDREEYTVAARTVRSLRITDKRPPEERPQGNNDD
jgi:predicted phage-related endonuclease